MPSVRETRVYVDQSETVEAYVAADLGVAVARVARDKVGEFSLVERCTARDVATTARGIAAATTDAVLVGDDDGFEPTGFGPAVAVGSYDEGVLAAGGDGRLAHYDGDDWTTLGSVDTAVRAIDGDLVAVADGVHRVTDDGVSAVGLDDVRDVAVAGVPLAATSAGLYRLGAGWMLAHDGDFRVAASDPVTADAGALGRAYAATPDALYEYVDDDGQAGDGTGAGADEAAGDETSEAVDETADGERNSWRARDIPLDSPVADVAYATDGVVVLTEDGALAVDAGEGFRHRSLGLRDASALAVVAEGNA
jgi:hypothetical protein